ncbi:MAG: hypothetical protein WAN72_10685 [Candidatus Acidiferrales bacterium]
MKLLEIWRRLFSTRYSAILEAEVARLRAENRALLNSILGIAGVPPITVSAAETAVRPGTLRTSAAGTKTASATAVAAGSRGSAKTGVSVAAPTRRRSWHQVYRMLEIDAARKKEAS